MLDKNKYTSKSYLHFDQKVKIEHAESYVTNPLRIANHSFLPLIHFVSAFFKHIDEKNIHLENKPIKEKKRLIMFAGHWDSFIYKYYSEMLNNKYYNSFCKINNIDNCVTAYRNNKPKKSNIDFAAEIINEIVLYKESYIIVGDFSKYFDQIDHNILKNNLKKVMGLNYLTKDWYNVFRSITKYGFYEKDFLSDQLGSDNYFRSIKKKSYFDKIAQFREFQKQFPPNYNSKKYGIPQGTAISAVFANIYSIDFDIRLKNIADIHNGLYRRYSDDFILVIPKSPSLNSKYIFDIANLIKDQANNNKILINEDKTKLYLYQNDSILNLKDSKLSRLDYLGFVFDGKSVKMRGKSPYKFYRQANKLIHHAKKRKNARKLKKLPYRKSIYALYTDTGTKHGSYSNFIDYAKRAQIKFDEISPHTNNMILNQIKNKKKKIEKMLEYNTHIKP